MTWLGRNICYSPEGGAGAGEGNGNQGGQGGAGQGGAGGGAGAKPWYDGKLDAESLGHIELKGWKKDDVADVAINAVKAHRELQKHFGVPETQLLKLPKDTADEAGWKAVYSRLGVPDDPKGYDLAAVKHADGRDMDAALADTLRAAMLNARVPKDRATDIAKAVIKSADDRAAATAAEAAARIKTERDALAANWKQNFEFNRLTAMEGARRLGVTKETLAKLEGELGGAQVMEMFRKIGAGTSEDSFHDGGQNNAPTTQNGAKAQLAQLMADPAWGKRLTAGDAATKREFDNLMLTIHGQAA